MLLRCNSLCPTHKPCYKSNRLTDTSYTMAELELHFCDRFQAKSLVSTGKKSPGPTANRVSEVRLESFGQRVFSSHTGAVELGLGTFSVLLGFQIGRFSCNSLHQKHGDAAWAGIDEGRQTCCTVGRSSGSRWLYRHKVRGRKPSTLMLPFHPGARRRRRGSTPSHRRRRDRLKSWNKGGVDRGEEG